MMSFMFQYISYICLAVTPADVPGDFSKDKGADDRRGGRDDDRERDRDFDARDRNRDLTFAHDCTYGALRTQGGPKKG